MSAIWVVRAGKGGKFADEYEEHGLAAIDFGNVMPDDVAGLTRNEIAKRMHENDDSIPEGTARNYAGQLYRFANEISPADWIITPDSGTRELMFGQVAGAYRHQPTGSPVAGFRHTLPVTWKGRRSRDLLPQRILYSLGSVLTVFQPKGREHLLAFMQGGDVGAAPDQLDLEGDEVDDADLFADLEARSDELIQQKIAFLDGHETQDLFAGILQAMGYYTQVAAEGADGGIDIIASRDPLAVEPPIIKVQVKARPSSKSKAPDLRQLTGVLREGERGIFVSTGGFTKDALAESATGKVQLVDIDRLQDLLVEYYDRLDQDTKSLVPLRRLYFP